MTVVVEQPPEDSGGEAVAGVAFAAGEATANVEHLEEQVSAVEELTAISNGVAADAIETASEALINSARIIEQNEQIMQQNVAIMAGLQMLAEALDNQQTEPEPEPEPEPKKRTAPKRKSGAHRFLYGE